MMTSLARSYPHCTLPHSISSLLWLLLLSKGSQRVAGLIQIPYEPEPRHPGVTSLSPPPSYDGIKGTRGRHPEEGYLD
jgi:hypothetical protein